jgi:TRAP-type mannitol/chloroaromatic compound transport system permease small subunit
LRNTLLIWAIRLKRVSQWTGRIIAWGMLPMVAIQFVIVLLRYWFDIGWIWMQEGVLWMHAAVFMLASAYTLHHDEHVRVDIFYRNLGRRGRTVVDISGTVFLLLPMMIFLMIASWDYVSVSWAIEEGSREAGGLPYPFVPLLKSLIPLTAGLVVLQGIANLLGDIIALRDGVGADDASVSPPD